MEVEETSGRRQRLVVTELPYQVNKARLLEKIADLVKEKRISGIQDIRDESDRDGMRAVLELKVGEIPKVIENQLYKYTQLEMTFGVIMLAVVNNKPQVLNLREILLNFLEFRRTIIVRRTQFELRQAEKRAHILEGLKKALDHLDELIQLIRAAESPPVAKQQLMLRFAFSDLQAQAILEMRLQRLTGLEQDKILEDYRNTLANIEYHQQVLASPSLVNEIIHKELQELIDQYGDERRTQIIGDTTEMTIEDLITEEEVVVTLSLAGYIKRKPTAFYRSQRRGGKGRTGMGTREKDVVTTVFTASTHDYLLLFTNQGRVYWLKVHEIPDQGPASVGKALVNLIPLQDQERLATILPVKNFQSGQYVMMATKQGVVKKTSLMAFSNPRPSGIWAIVIDQGDELISARITDGEQQLFLMSRAGKSVRIHEQLIRSTGRVSRGVRGMDVDESELVGMEIIGEQQSILVVTERGFGKRTSNAQYRPQGRGGKGVINLRITERNGPVVNFRQVTDEDQVILITDKGRLIRTNVAEVSMKGRLTQGVKLMDLDEDEKVVDLTVVMESEDAEEGE
jgi:DNA gyrase subunit A